MRRCTPKAVALLMVGCLVAGVGIGPGRTADERPGPREHEVKGPPRVADGGDVWVLDFRFHDLRSIAVDVPGEGRKTVSYLRYRVSNNTGRPRTFRPDFQLVAQDRSAVHREVVIPAAVEAIRRAEAADNPPVLLDAKAIAAKPIPEDGTVAGVATWVGVDPQSNRLSVFVGGLSNARVVTDDGVERRKTLQLNFIRKGDEVRFVPPAQWLYRAAALKKTGEGEKSRP
jgi:hypothetical protein